MPFPGRNAGKTGNFKSIPAGSGFHRPGQGIGHSGAWFLLFKAKATNAFGDIYMAQKDYTTAVDVNRNFITPKMLQFRLQKIPIADQGRVRGRCLHYVPDQRQDVGRGRAQA